MHLPRNNYTRGNLKIFPLHLLNTVFTFHCYITNTSPQIWKLISYLRSPGRLGWVLSSGSRAGVKVRAEENPRPLGPAAGGVTSWGCAGPPSAASGASQLKALCFSPSGASILNQQMMRPPVWNLTSLAWENSAQRAHMINNVINNDTWLLNGATIALESHTFVQRHLYWLS